MKVIVIGGVAAGMSAASKLKRLMPESEIVVYEKGEDLSYGACGMPYYISDVIGEESKLVARTKAQFEEKGIRVRVNTEATGVDTEKRAVTLKERPSGETYEDVYDKLIIASGAGAIRLPVEGRESKRIHVVNTLEDSRNLKKALNKPDVKDVAVIGGGFIGIEMVESIREMGLNAHLVELENQVLPGYDKDMMEHVRKSLEDHAVSLHLEEEVTAYEEKDGRIIVHTKTTSFGVDLVIEAIGVRPNTGFLKNTPVERIKNGAILVNDRNETSVRDIYAAGDCATVYHRLKSSYEAYIPLGTHANKAGRVIAEQISGSDKRFEGVIGSSVLKAFELTVAKTGLTEKECKALGIDYGSISVKAANQAGYYPGAKPVFIKLTYDTHTCNLLGAQMVGEKGVGSRINIFATAIWNRMSAEAVSDMDLAYAPPFSPVWDTVQIATNQIKCQRSDSHEK